MSKNIIFCADGTWNGPNNDDNKDDIPDYTNVLRLFNELDGSADTPDMFVRNEQEKTLRNKSGVVLQVSKYIHGVGDSNNWLDKMLGGVFGAGIIERIVRGYTFICRNYDRDDDIFLIGFSRGAYTARALAGMIGECGLLDKNKIDLTDKEEAYRLGTAVWRQYRQKTNVDGSLLDRIIRDAPMFLHEQVDPNKIIYFVPIKAVTVWETVGSLGIPEYIKDARIDAFKFASTALGGHVKYGRQAIAIDEMRLDFTPTFWDKRDNIVQLYFPGIHADVGGGYSSTNNGTGLSNGAYLWIRTELGQLGVHLDPVQVNVDFKGPIHCEWHQIPYKLGVRQLRRPDSPDLAIHSSAVSRMAWPTPLPVQDNTGMWGAQLYHPASIQPYVNASWQPLNGIVIHP